MVKSEIHDDEVYFSRSRRPWIYFMDVSHVSALVIVYYGVTMGAIWNGLWSRDGYVMTLLRGVVSEAKDVLFYSGQM